MGRGARPGALGFASESKQVRGNYLRFTLAIEGGEVTVQTPWHAGIKPEYYLDADVRTCRPYAGIVYTAG